jgi:hypothetical protein
MPNQEGHGGHLRCVHKYLAEYPITKEFYENFQAPMTEAKQSEIDTQEVIRPWRDEIKEIITLSISSIELTGENITIHRLSPFSNGMASL